VRPTSTQRLDTMFVAEREPRRKVAAVAAPCVLTWEAEEPCRDQLTQSVDACWRRRFRRELQLPHERNMITGILMLSRKPGGVSLTSTVGSHQKWAILNPSGHMPLLSGTARRKLRPLSVVERRGESRRGT
jgi:hypothetical protein